MTIIISCRYGKNNIVRYETWFNFLYPVSITPNSDSVNVGDTLWIGINLPDSIYENTDSRKFYLPSFDFQSYISVRKLVDNTANWSFQLNFNTKNSIGSIYKTTSSSIDFQPVYKNNHYDFKGSIIPKDIG